MKSCAIELAEAEQSLAFLRNGCCVSRDKVYQCKQKIERLEKCIMDITQDPEIVLTQKMNQICIQTNDYPTTSRNEDVVSTSRIQASRVNRAIEKVKEIQRKKSLALGGSQMMNNIVPHQALKRKCEKTVQTYTRNATPTKVRA